MKKKTTTTTTVVEEIIEEKSGSLSVFILLDKSGSMASQWNEAIGSINGYVAKLDPATQIQLDAFDSLSYDEVRNCTAKKWKKVTNEDVKPGGSTPLYDSCARIMTKGEATQSKKMVLVVMTDGEENASHEHNKESIKARIKMWENKEWPVVVLGANFDAVDTVSGYVGVLKGRSMNMTTGNYAASMDRLATHTSVYTSSIGTAEDFMFNDEDRAVASGAGSSSPANVVLKKSDIKVKMKILSDTQP